MPPLPVLLLSLAAVVPTGAAAEPMTDSQAREVPVHARCAQLRVGMNYRDALAIMGSDPDSTLSGHSAAGPDGNPPPGSYAIDFWHGTDAQGVAVVSSFRYSGGVLESVDCARPATHSPSTPAES